MLGEMCYKIHLEYLNLTKQCSHKNIWISLYKHIFNIELEQADKGFICDAVDVN